MERLFVYSMEHERTIRLIWQEEDGCLVQANVRVTAWDGRNVSFVAQRPKRVRCVPVERVLSADFRKGDEGEG